MEDLHFAIMELIVESEKSGKRFVFPTKETFDNLENNFSYSKDGFFYEINVKKQDDYIFFVFKFGHPEPRDENLTNIKTGDKIPNMRTIEETELNNQGFFLFHYGKNFLYTSNSRKKGLFEVILKEKLGTDFVVKYFTKNEEEFIKIFKECNSISFTHVRDLFNDDSTKKRALVDLTGTDAPERFTIIAEYKENAGFIDFLRKIFVEKRENKIDSLIICGRDERGFETFYNVETFLQKIKISCKKDSNGNFIDDEVCDALLKEIQNER